MRLRTRCRTVCRDPGDTSAGAGAVTGRGSLLSAQLLTKPCHGGSFEVRRPTSVRTASGWS